MCHRLNVALVGVDARVTTPGTLAGDGDLEVKRNPNVLVDGIRWDIGYRETAECLVGWQLAQQSHGVPAGNALVQTEQTSARTDTSPALDERRKYVVAHAQTALFHLAQVR